MKKVGYCVLPIKRLRLIRVLRDVTLNWEILDRYEVTE